jgi:hypothetical protein
MPFRRHLFFNVTYALDYCYLSQICDKPKINFGDGTLDIAYQFLVNLQNGGQSKMA